MKDLKELDLGKWNGKVYGKKQYNSCNIYLNGEKINISNEDADKLESLDYTPIYYRKEEKIEKKEINKILALKAKADKNSIPYWGDEKLSECYGY